MSAFAARGFEPRTEPVRVRVWRRVSEKVELLEPEKKELGATALGWSAPSPEGGVEGEVVELNSLADAQKLTPGALAGKVAFYNISTERTRDGSGYGRGWPVRALGAKAAQQAGAVASLMRSLGTDTDDDTPHTGSMRSGTASIPAMALSHKAADTLHAHLAARKTTRVRVMAEIAGQTRPEEIVLVGAHLDSWDLGRGALDDGAGVGVVMAALTELRNVTLARTVRVVLFAAEESSLAGGRAYLDAHRRELSRHVLGVEIDGGTHAAYETRLGCSPSVIEAHGQALNDLMAPLGAPMSEREGDGGADISPLHAAGMPILELRQDMSTYFDVHHTSKDTPDRLDAEHLDHLVHQLAAAVEYAANTELGFGRFAGGPRR